MHHDDEERARATVESALREDDYSEAIRTLVDLVVRLNRDIRSTEDGVNLLVSMFDEDALTAQSRVKLLEQQLADAKARITEVDEMATRVRKERDEYKHALDVIKLLEFRQELLDAREQER